MNSIEKKYTLILVLLTLLIFLFLTLSCCISAKKTPINEIKPGVINKNPAAINIPKEERTNPIILSWEKTDVERIEWSQYLISKVESNLTTFDKAKDVTKFCSKYFNLNNPQKVKMWSELFVKLSYYESSWKPNDASVDVGQTWNKDSWSVGLFSVSVVDQESYGFKDINYKYLDLLKPLPNIDLAVKLIAFQINKVGKIAIGPDRKWLYFATLHPGGRYDKTNEIISHTNSLEFCK